MVALDRAALVALSEIRSEPMDTVMRTLTFLGSTAWIGALAVTVGGGLLWFRYYRALSQVLLACLGSWALMLVLKPLIGQRRPDFIQPLIEASGFAFPSGHALMATAAYLTLALVTRRHLRHRHARFFVPVFACLLALVIGGSRAYLGVHYPSDALGGILLGIFWTALLEAAMRPSST